MLVIRVLRLAALLLAFGATTAHAQCDPRAEAPTSGLGAFLADVREILTPSWCGTGSYGETGWMKRDATLAPTTDATGTFKRRYADVKAKRSPLPADAKEPIYLVVTGLFTKHYPGYMKSNIARLKERGLEMREVPVDTSGSVEKNAAIVRDWVLDASAGGRKVVILSHSKGGVDTTAAMTLYPEIESHIRAHVAMQSPFGGTPIASDLRTCNAGKWMTRHFVEDVISGDPNSVFDLGYAERRAFLKAHPYVSKVPTISLATARSSFFSGVGMTDWYMQARYGIQSDGMVPIDEAELPGSLVVRLDDMDHVQSTFRYVPGNPYYNPGDITEALLTMALDASR